ncbi:MAG: hypothetical protein ACK40M_11945 [Flavobacteriales bacterium]
MKRRVIRLALLAFVAVSVSSCGLFRKKNKCHTCPHWSYEQSANDAQSRG